MCGGPTLGKEGDGWRAGGVNYFDGYEIATLMYEFGVKRNARKLAIQTIF